MPELVELQPQLVWRYFAGLASVPRPSKQEEQIQQYVLQLAQELKLEARRDHAGNIVIRVPASPQCESAPITVLQGHLDMVCEKNAETKHDFSSEAIRLVLDTDVETGEQILRADGTTLGADNGIGVAMALAAATDPQCKHGPLEILCTADEEAGMTGAKALTPESVRGRRMINLDSEEDDAIYIGCAGGCDTTLTWRLKTGVLQSGWEAVRVKVSGLKGGHSGSDIHLNRGNAIKILASVLLSAGEEKLQLAEFAGGSKRNAIPREAEALIAGPSGVIAQLREAAQQLIAETVSAAQEPECQVDIESAVVADSTHLANPGDTRRVLLGIAALPSGPLAIVPDIPGLVQTSSNVATATRDFDEGRSELAITVGCLTRSSSSQQLRQTVRQITSVAALAGAEIRAGNQYPGWQPNVDSPLLETARRVYAKLFDAPPRVAAIHAGLECGIIGERIGGMDMISIGPRIEGAHSPDERVFIGSVQKSYGYLVSLLAALAR